MMNISTPTGNYFMKQLILSAIILAGLNIQPAVAADTTAQLTSKQEQVVNYLNDMISRQERSISQINQKIAALESDLLKLERMKGVIQERMKAGTGFFHRTYIADQHYTFSILTKPNKKEYSDSSVYDAKLARCKAHNEGTVKRIDTLVHETKAGIEIANRDKGEQQTLLEGFIEQKKKN